VSSQPPQRQTPDSYSTISWLAFYFGMDCHSEPFAVILSEAKHLALGAQGKLREESRSPPGGLKAKEQSEIPRCARNDIS